MEMGQRGVIPKEMAPSWLTVTWVQGSRVIGPEPHASGIWRCRHHSWLPQTNNFLSTAHWNKLEFQTAVNRTSFIPEAFLRQRASAPAMTEVSPLMSPSCWMKLCFEITAKRRAWSVSAGNVRSWSFFLLLSVWNTCTLVEERTMVSFSLCVGWGWGCLLSNRHTCQMLL